MSESTHIKDAFGKRIPLLDSHGNLTLEVIMLYSEDKLTETDRNTVDAFAATDEMSRDTLDGYALTGNPSKTRYIVAQLADDIEAKTGAAAATTGRFRDDEFNFRRMAAGIALLIALGGITFFTARYFSGTELADGTKKAGETKEATGSPTKMDKVSNSHATTDTIDAGLLPVEDDIAEKDHVDVAANRLAEPEVLQLEELAGGATVRQQMDLTVVSETVEETNDQAREPADREADTRGSREFSSVLMADSVGTGSGEGQVMVSAESEDETVESVSLDMANEEERQEDLADIQAEKKRKREEWLAKAAAEKEASRAAVKEQVALERNRRELSGSEELGAAKAAESTEMQEVALEQAEMARAGEAAAITAAGIQPEEEPASPVDAKYPGGDMAMYKFIEKKKDYTEAMRVQDLRGVVVVNFDIEPDGRVANAKVKTGVTGLLNEDALRVVRSMPDWSPAQKGGNAVRSSRSVAVKYGE